MEVMNAASWRGKERKKKGKVTSLDKIFFSAESRRLHTRRLELPNIQPIVRFYDY